MPMAADPMHILPPWGNSGPPSGVLPVTFRDTSGGVRVHPGRGAAAGRGMNLEMEKNNIFTPIQQNKNKNKNNKEEAEEETITATRLPSPARPDRSTRSTRSSLGLKARTDRGLSRSTSYEIKDSKIVLRDILKVDLDLHLIQRSEGTESILGSSEEVLTSSPVMSGENSGSKKKGNILGYRPHSHSTSPAASGDLCQDDWPGERQRRGYGEWGGNGSYRYGGRFSR